MKLLTPFYLVLLNFLLLGHVYADSGQAVLQVDASLTINHQIEFSQAPFILLEGEPSTLAEEGLGGYKVEMLAQANVDGSYAVTSKIYNYIRSGYKLLAIKTLNLRLNESGNLNIESKSAGPVSMAIKIVKQAQLSSDSSKFGQSVR